MPVSDLVQNYLGAADESTRAHFSRLANLIASADPAITAAIKWGKLTFALDGDYHHWLCALAKVKKGVSLYFHFGSLLDDPRGILQTGASRWMRKIDFIPGEPFNPQALTALVRQALVKLPDFKSAQKDHGKAA